MWRGEINLSENDEHDASTNAPLYLGIAFFAPEIVASARWTGPFRRSPENSCALGRDTLNKYPVGSLLFGMGRAELALKWNLGLSLLCHGVCWVAERTGRHGLRIAKSSDHIIYPVGMCLCAVVPCRSGRVHICPEAFSCRLHGTAFW